MQIRRRNLAAIQQVNAVIQKSKSVISKAETETEKAMGFAMCEAYLQVFFFCGVIKWKEYIALWEEMKSFRKEILYLDGMEKKICAAIQG